MANNSEIIGEEATVRQIVEDDFSATDGVFTDDSVTIIKRSNTLRTKSTLHKIFLPGLSDIIETGGVSYCDKLILADIGGCKELKGTVFSNDGVLTALIIRRSSVTTLSNVNVFTSTKYATSGAGGVYVYVPRNLIATYQSATNWATLYAAHSDMFRAIEDYTVDGTVTGKIDEQELFPMTTPSYSMDEQVFDGATYFDTGIQLYDTVDSEFTILLDYTLEQWTTNTRILHCRDESTNEGLRYGRHSNNNNNATIYKNAPGTSAMSGDGNGYGGAAGDHFLVIIVGTNTGIRVYSRINYTTPNPNNVSYTYSGTRTTMNRNLLIGAGRNSSNDMYGYFKGTIHKLRVYKKALEDWEISEVLYP